MCLQCFDALGWMAERASGLLKKLEWWGAGVVMCLEWGADLHMAQLMSLPLTVSCFIKIQIGLVLTFWYRLTRVVPYKRPLNGCACVIVYFVYIVLVLPLWRMNFIVIEKIAVQIWELLCGDGSDACLCRGVARPLQPADGPWGSARASTRQPPAQARLMEHPTRGSARQPAARLGFGRQPHRTQTTVQLLRPRVSMYNLAALFSAKFKVWLPGFPRLPESAGIVFVTFPGPGKKESIRTVFFLFLSNVWQWLNIYFSMDTAINHTVYVVSNCCLSLYLNIAGFWQGSGKMHMGSW